MKKKRAFIKTVFALAAALTVLLAGTSALALDDDVNGQQAAEPETEEYVEATEYVQPETEYVQPETEYVQPETEYVQPTDEPWEPATEYAEKATEPAAEATENVQSETVYQYMPIETYPTDGDSSNAYQTPTLAKTVSTKSYTTNYTAGIVSWACVAMGIVTAAAVLISTKAKKKR